MTANRQDVTVGAIFVVIGGYFSIEAFTSLPIGSALRMGPGFFPIVLAAILIALGALIGANGLRARVKGEPRPIPWRGLAVFVLVPIFFGATIRTLGFIPTVALSVFISAFASRRMTVLYAVVLSAAMTAFCVAVFHYGLGLPVRLMGAWFYNIG